MISRLPGVYAVQTTGATTASAYRSPLIPAVNTNALTVDAATLDLTAAAEPDPGPVPQCRHPK
jgi:putative ABC transport system permease protein